MLTHYSLCSSNDFGALYVWILFKFDLKDFDLWWLMLMWIIDNGVVFKLCLKSLVSSDQTALRACLWLWSRAAFEWYTKRIRPWCSNGTISLALAGIPTQNCPAFSWASLLSKPCRCLWICSTGAQRTRPRSSSWLLLCMAASSRTFSNCAGCGTAMLKLKAALRPLRIAGTTAELHPPYLSIEQPTRFHLAHNTNSTE